MTLVQSVEACMRQVYNAFEYDMYEGPIAIVGGIMSPAPNCEWVWIEGGFRNNGLHHFDEQDNEIQSDLRDECFTGKYWRLIPPKDFLEVCQQVSDFTEKIHPYDPISESFGDYSVTNGRSESGNILTWQDSYREQLSKFYGIRQMPGGVFY